MTGGFGAVIDRGAHYWALIPLGVAGIVSWSVWLLQRVLSARYRPVKNKFRMTTSVVVPAYREDSDVLERCLHTWLAQNPTEIIVVPDVADRELIERLADSAHPGVRVIPFAHEGKRSAWGYVRPGSR